MRADGAHGGRGNGPEDAPPGRTPRNLTRQAIESLFVQLPFSFPVCECTRRIECDDGRFPLQNRSISLNNAPDPDYDSAC